MRRLAFGSFLEEDEHIVRVFHRPLLFLLTKLFLWMIPISIGVFLAWFFVPYPQLYITLTALGSIRIFTLIFFWYANAILMTNESIIYVDWPKVFEKRSTRIDYTNLDEITTEKIGINSFLLNYGNIFFKKLGGDNLATYTIACPNRTARIIEKYREDHMDQINFNQESTLKGILASMTKNHLEKSGFSSQNLEKITHLDSEANSPEKPPITSSETPDQKSQKIKKTPEKYDLDDISIEKTLDEQGGISIKF
jgi:hypothetical protein